MQVWTGMILVSAIYSILSGTTGELAAAALEGAGAAITTLAAMAGGYMLWLGVFEIAERTKLTQRIASAIQRPLAALFPGAGKDKKAMSAAAMNIAANMLGLGNAATPFGLKAMERMKELSKSDEASDDMIMLIIVNCSAVTIIPTTIITLLSAHGSQNPFAITLPCLFATVLTTAAGICAALLLRDGKNKSRKKGKSRG